MIKSPPQGIVTPTEFDAYKAENATKIANHRNIFFSTINPTIADGENGDVWFTYTPFAPTQIEGLILSLDASTLDLADAAPVASWTDTSVSVNHAVQTTEAWKPILKTNVQNGLSMVEFNGLNNRLMCGQRVLSSSLFSIFVVVKGNKSADVGLIEQHSGSADIDRTGFLASTPDYKAKFFVTTSSGLQEVITQSNVFDNTCKIVTTMSNGAGLISLGVNGVEEGSLAGIPWAPLDHPMSIGGHGQAVPSGGYTGNIGEVLIYDAYLSVNDRQKIEQHLANKWGVALNE